MVTLKKFAYTGGAAPSPESYFHRCIEPSPMLNMFLLDFRNKYRCNYKGHECRQSLLNFELFDTL